MGGLESGPSPKMGGFWGSSSLKKKTGDFGNKNNKKNNMKSGVFWPRPKMLTKEHIFLKRGSFVAAQAENVRSGPGQKLGAFGWHIPVLP